MKYINTRFLVIFQHFILFSIYFAFYTHNVIRIHIFLKLDARLTEGTRIFILKACYLSKPATLKKLD